MPIQHTQHSLIALMSYDDYMHNKILHYLDSSVNKLQRLVLTKKMIINLATAKKYKDTKVKENQIVTHDSNDQDFSVLHIETTLTIVFCCSFSIFCRQL